jgi:phosphoglycolate phosphatase
MPTLLIGDKKVNCKLLIFDKDGTLVDPKPLLLCLAKARYSSLDRLLGEQVAEKWAEAVGVNLLTEEVDRKGPLAMAPTREEVLVAAFVIYRHKQLGWDTAKQLAEQAYEQADREMTSPYGAVLLDGVSETLCTLKSGGFKIALATTDSHRRAEESLKKLGIGSCFNAVVGADDIENGKPAPDMILKACKLVGCQPYDTVMVGDSASDMLMGKNARVKLCIGVLGGFASRQTLQKNADVIVLSVTSLSAAHR